MNRASLRATVFLVGWVVLGMLFAGCGGGGGGGENSTPNPNAGQEPSPAGANQALLGPLAGAEIRAYRLTDLDNPVEGPITANDSLTDLTVAGTFDLELAGISGDEWILVTATGGWDIDADDDGVLDAEPTENLGTIHALAKAGEWRTEGAKLTAISDILFRRIMQKSDLASLSSSEIREFLDQATGEWLGDINNDGQINYADVLAFTPHRDHAKTLISWNTTLRNFISSIHAGASESILMKRLEYMESIVNAGYTARTASAQLIVNDAVRSYIMEVVDTDRNGSANVAIVREMNGRAYSESRITSLDATSSSYWVRFEVDGRTLELEFMAPHNALTGLDETSLQLLFENANLKKELISIDDQEILQIAIPNVLMPSFSAAELNIKIDGTYYHKEVLEVISDNPLIGWKFYEEEGEDHEIDLPPGFFDPEPMAYNEGDLLFTWRRNECRHDEATLGSFDYYGIDGELKLNADAEHSLCLGHITLDLANYYEHSPMASTIFSYKNDIIYQPQASPSDAVPVRVGVVGAFKDYQIETAIHWYDESPGSDWSCGMSFEKFWSGSGKFGDCAYGPVRLWARVVEVGGGTGGDSGNAELIEGRYRIIGAGGGIVEDVDTGLQWMRCSLEQSWDGSTCTGPTSYRYTWQGALDAADAFNLADGYGGYTDWRVPSIEELKTLVYCSSGDPDYFKTSNSHCGGIVHTPTIVREAFPRTPSDWFCSSSPYALYGNYAWYINFHSGYVFGYSQSGVGRVRLVRAGQ